MRNRTRLGRISELMATSAPVFIIGEARSGTSMLYRVLLRHSAFTPRRECLQETKIYEFLPRAFTFRRGYPSGLLEYMLQDHVQYSKFLASIRPLRPVLALAALPGVLFRERVPLWLWIATGGRAVVRGYFHFALLARGARRTLEKSPRHWLYVRNLLATFPQAKLLYIHRHPVDVYGSYRRRQIVALETGSPAALWASIKVEDFCDDYRRAVREVSQAACACPNSVRLLAYEMFTSDPAAELARICDFIGEPFEEELLVDREPDTKRVTDDPYLFQAITARTKDWRDYLTPVQAAKIEDELGEAMQLLGYTRYTPPGRAIDGGLDYPA
jgi:hypothetical protein